MIELESWPLDNKRYTSVALGAAYAARSRGLLTANSFTLTTNGDNTLTLDKGLGCLHVSEFWACFPYSPGDVIVQFEDAAGVYTRKDVLVFGYADDSAAPHANAVAAKYEAKLSLDSWVASTSEEKAGGYTQAQEVTLTAVTPGAPTVMAASEFLTGCGYDPTGVAATDEILDEVLAIVNAGLTRSLDGGKIRTIVKEKPAADIVLHWVIRTEVS